MQARRLFDLLACRDVAGRAQNVRFATNLDHLRGDQSPAPLTGFRAILEFKFFQPALVAQQARGVVEIARVGQEAEVGNRLADDSIGACSTSATSTGCGLASLIVQGVCPSTA